ncbi:DUF5667 domain-containing protein [Streptomyces sp. TRM 70361]|uniref:DUF5667 domain-containing protein n=1 Tax=Streptomyces sp. TRM 70361 TaxID=3116553 RepID=UPI002E7BB001|nr:DUF5667 domain-containing protein [Streptomyces sp. TRM 70361]MEE1940386.1 DUF5667 domain-containing protein [Streptomyces sp. TRM 70361]
MGAVSPSRRANAFAQALDEREPGDTAAADRSASTVPAVPADPDAPRPAGTAKEPGGEEILLALAGRLASLPKPELAADVRAAQRARLVAAAESAFAEDGEGSRAAGARTGHGGARRALPVGPLGRLRPRSRLGRGLAVGGLGFGVAAGAFTGAAAASTDALPGDTLYGLKLGMEDLKLDLADDDADRGKVHLNHAATRLHETRRLLERTRSGPLDEESLTDIRRVLSRMRHDASEGHRLLSRAYEREGALGPMRELSSFSRSHRDVWGQVRDRLPLPLTEVGDEVSSVLDAIEDEITPLRSLLSDTPQDAESTGGGTGDSRTDDGRTSGPTPSAPDGARGGPRETTGQPATPSGSRETGGAGEAREGSPSGDGERPGSRRDGSGTPSASRSEATELPKPEITIPPIVPELLPDLGDTRSGTD